MFDSIMVALDGSSHSDKALQSAIELAKRCNAKIVLFHALQQTPLSGNYAAMVAKAARKAYAKIAREQADEILARARKAAKAGGLEKIEQVVREGDPAKIVVKRAKKLDVDLLVVGTRGLTGIKGITLGSVAHKVTAAAHCPVLVVK